MRREASLVAEDAVVGLVPAAEDEAALPGGLRPQDELVLQEVVGPQRVRVALRPAEERVDASLGDERELGRDDTLVVQRVRVDELAGELRVDGLEELAREAVAVGRV